MSDSLAVVMPLYDAVERGDNDSPFRDGLVTACHPAPTLEEALRALPGAR